MIENKINISQTFGGRLDPQFYNPKYISLVKKIERNGSKPLYRLAKFSAETWNQKDFFDDFFPYIEISAIDTNSGDITEISNVEKKCAPSRAKKIARKNDILISTTRPNRGAISLVASDDLYIASTGFAVVRDLSDYLLRDYLFIALRQSFCLEQMAQRSSGGNYPAITEDELKKITIPTPSKEVQQRIVDIYSKASEQKRAKEQEAQTLLDSIDSYLLGELGITLPETSQIQLAFKVNISEMLGNRFDVSFYRDRFELISSKYPSCNLSELLHINPSVKYNELNDNDEISFVPMEVIDEKRGVIAEHRTTTVANTKGFTKFEDNDLLWAKITPCMQNGKSAIVRNLINGCGCGSTEFYVLRPKTAQISIEYIHIIMRNKQVLEAAKNSFGGSAGQQRVSSGYLKSIKIPNPPLAKQNEIAETISTIRAKASALQAEASAQLATAKQQIEKIILG